ncbi:MAG: hypothetical protein JST68_20220 [Bacteroidetes bacterium]|nr:hypothetical protein [Bacteroidota bacterium]
MHSRCNGAFREPGYQVVLLGYSELTKVHFVPDDNFITLEFFGGEVVTPRGNIYLCYSKVLNFLHPKKSFAVTSVTRK